MLDLLSGFVTELRRSGIPVSLTEHLDAAEAVRHIPLEDREGLKYALAATLVKSSSHWRAFETAFEVFFAVRTGAGAAGEGEEDGTDGQAGAAGGSLTELEERLAQDEFKARLDRFRGAVETEIRRRLVEDRGSEALAKSVRKPLPEDIDVMHATRDELAMLHRVLHPLSRKLAVRLARKRRHGRKGPLDFRATMRRSLSTGGVPVEPRFRHPRPAKPEIFVIADISGSVASFARFTLHLVYAISSQFSKVRSFVFVDGIDEVTRFFEGVVDPAEAVFRINTEADVIWVDGHSDYGHALTEFHRRWGDQITSRSSILVLGDARNNYHASQSWVLEDLQARARHVFWLNPEPRDYWGSGDSIVGEYGTHCDEVVECRTLRQLEHFVGNLA